MRVRALRRTLPAAALGAAAALLIASCGSSGRGLIPSANAGPLQGDFERVVQEAESGGGSCAGTEAALSKTEQDYGALPAIDPGLRKRLQEGISKLRSDALSLCAQPHPQATVTSTTRRTITPPRTTATPTVTQPTTTQTTPANTTTTAPEGGGTPAPGTGAGGEPAPSGGQGAGGSPSSGGAPGSEAGGPGAAGNGVTPQEPAK